MNEENTLRAIYWLILFTGSLAIVYGSLWASLYLFGRVLKMLGMWRDTMKTLVLYYALKRNNKVIKFKGATYKLVNQKEVSES